MTHFLKKKILTSKQTKRKRKPNYIDLPVSPLTTETKQGGLLPTLTELKNLHSKGHLARV